MASLLSSQNLSRFIQKGKVDFGRTSDLYAKHRPGPPNSLYARLVHLFRQALPHKDIQLHVDEPEHPQTPAETKEPTAAPADEQRLLRVLDVGTGTGVFGITLAKLTNALVTGVDISSNQIEAAQRVAQQAGVGDRCRFFASPVERTGLPDRSFDVITASTCWHWFDTAATLRECERLLATNGLLVITQYVYSARLSRLAHLTEQLILKYNPKWRLFNFNGANPEQIDQVEEGGFKLLEQFAYNYDQPFTKDTWIGRIHTCNGVGSSDLSAEQLQDFDRELRLLLDVLLPDADSFVVPHRIWTVVAQKTAEFPCYYIDASKGVDPFLNEFLAHSAASP